MAQSRRFWRSRCTRSLHCLVVAIEPEDTLELQKRYTKGTKKEEGEEKQGA